MPESLAMDTIDKTRPLLSLWAVLGPLITLFLGIWLTSIFKRRNFAYQTYRKEQIDSLADLYGNIVQFNLKMQTAWDTRNDDAKVSDVLLGLSGELKTIATIFKYKRIYFSPHLNRKLEDYLRALDGISGAIIMAGILTPIDRDTGEVATETKEWGENLIDDILKNQTPALLKSIEDLIRKNIK